MDNDLPTEQATSSDDGPTVKVTAVIGAWTNHVVRSAVALLAAANRIIPDFVVSFTANPKGPRLRVKNKDGSLGSLKLPCYIIPPLSGETADALAVDHKTAAPVAGKKRTLKIAPRFTLDRTYRGLVDLTMATDTKAGQTLSERIVALIYHLAAQVAVPPRCTTNTNKAGQVISKIVQHPEGWKAAAAILGLAVEGDNPDKYALTDVALGQCRSLLKEIGPFPVSGLGALDTPKDDKPKTWAVAVSTATNQPLTDKNNKPYKIRIPNDVVNVIRALDKPGEPGSGFVTVRLMLVTEQPKVATASVATAIKPKKEATPRPPRRKAPQPDAALPA